MNRRAVLMFTFVLALSACSDEPASGGTADLPRIDTGNDAALDGPSLDGSDPDSGAQDTIGDALHDASTDAGESDPVTDAGADTTADGNADLAVDGSDDTGDPSVIPPETIGGDRPAWVRVPTNYAERDDWPLIIVLHGYSAAGLFQDAYFGLSVRVTRKGFVLVIPDGTFDATGNRFWNAFFDDVIVDDVGYLTDLIDEAAAELRVDPERVYLIGHSNGAFMAHRMACEVADRVTAIGALAGTSFNDADECNPSEPVSVIHMHGTLDTSVAYNGGVIWGYDYPGAMESTEMWRDENGCAEASIEDSTLDYDAAVFGDETSREHWTDCDEDALVELWTMTASSHIPTVNNNFRDDLVDWLLARQPPAE